MPVVAFAGLEPKSGKTTCAVLVASALANRGGRVLLVDADPKQNALAWSNRALSRGSKIPTVVSAPNASSLLADLGARFDMTVVDLPPDANVQRVACKTADVVVIVSTPDGNRADATAGLDVDERAVFVTTRAQVGARPDDLETAALFVTDTKYATTVVFGSVATHGDLGDLVATVEKLASVVARRADVFDFEVTGDIPQPFVRIAIPSIPSSEPTDVTVAVDMAQFVRDMDTFVGVIERSFLTESTAESAATTRERLQDGLDAARKLLGMHFTNGETFVVNDGVAFFDAAMAADRIIATGTGLLDDMRRKNESTVMRPSLDALASQVRALVEQLRDLREG